MKPTLSQVHIQAALSDLSVAYMQEAPSVAERLFPRVSVSKQSDYYFVWSKADMWRPEAKKRSPGTDFARMGMGLSSEPYATIQYGLEYPIPDEIRANQDAAIDLEMTGTMTLVDQHYLRQDLDFATDFFTSSSGWTAGTVSTAWSTVATGTPVTDIIAGARAIRQALGASARYRLVGLGGEKIRSALLTSDQVRDRTKYVMAQTANAIEQTLAGVLGLDELIIDGREYNTKKEGVAPVYAPVFDRGFLIVARPIAPGLNTPSAGYTFAWDEGGRGDMYIEMYRDEIKKQDVLRSVCHYDQKQVAADLGVYFNNAVA
jgi:hypothetical protein